MTNKKLATLIEVKDKVYNLKDNAGISDVLDMLNIMIEIEKEIANNQDIDDFQYCG